MYWFSMFLCDILVNATISFFVMIPLFVYSFIAFHHFQIPVDLFVLLLLFGLSIIPLCYILSLFISKPSTAFACMWMYCISLEENIFQTTLDTKIVILLLFNMLVVFTSLIFLENAFDKMYGGYVPFQGYLNKSVEKQDKSEEDIINEANRIKHLVADGDTTEILKVIDLSKKVQGNYIVDHLTFSVPEGDCLGIIGSFGVGKTATMAMLSGAISPSEGDAYIKDSSLSYCLKRFQTFIGYCPQSNTLLNLLTGYEMLTLFANLRGVSDEAFVKLIIHKMDLQEDGTTLIKNYSFGDKRKLAVAVAAMGMPPVMLLDEPTTGVDFESQRKILQFIKELVDTKTQAIVLASSSIFDCQEVCTRFAVMDNGRFRHICSMPQLEEKYSSGYMMTIILKMEKQDDMDYVREVIHCIECNIPGSMLMKFDKGVFIYRVSDPVIELCQLCKFMQFLNGIFEFYKYFVTDISFIRVSFAHTLIT
ncbi:phospholipid-transporting ATPase ABCA3-like isoform X2 [Uloborus diversus]|uniref:phospholipid-transporting ATPase ABCA3-like isoform X2 n=1 Tax=Uloborus diversus TaxID=327109 RepID=UPI00240A9BFB|nr:phospholipid-transporting ATPase ABCA3-like isoform X2 [Uloborus diversus]